MATETKATKAKKEEKVTKVAKAPKSAKENTSAKNADQIAIIRTGSKQYIVKVGDVLRVEKIEEKDIKAGKVTFDDVLLFDDGKVTKIGTPVISASKVVAEVIDQVKDKKVVVIKYRAKSRYFKKRGHRQPKTFVKVTEIK